MSVRTNRSGSNYVIALGLATGMSMAILPVSALANTSAAAEDAGTEASNRLGNRLGFYVGIKEPSPALLGLNAAYNLFDFLRLSAGYGRVSVTSSLTIDNQGNVLTEEASATTLGFGARAFVPGWNLTPALGVHFAHISYSGSGLEVGGFEQSGSHVYTTLGADYQAKSGFNASAGIEYSFRSGVGASAFVNLGWFFNWLN